MIGVVSFPGSNGDHDALHSLTADIGCAARFVDFRETNLAGLTAIVLPGGFSYGDHLRCGAIARFAPVMAAVRRFAEAGGAVLGICNGFQVLTEANLLPGALLRNRTLRFHCQRVHIVVERVDTAWTSGLGKGEVLSLPVAHGDGAYFADEMTLTALERDGQVVARYCDVQGNISHKSNHNGSLSSIAAITNQNRNIVGMMPHPERATSNLIGGSDGVRLLRAGLATLSQQLAEAR